VGASEVESAADEAVRVAQAAAVKSPASTESASTVKFGDWEGTRPRFSADGNRMVFHSGQEGARSIMLGDLQTGGATELVSSDADDVEPTFSQDDSRVIFSSNRDGDYDLYIVDIESGEVEKITDDVGDEREPSVASVLFGFYAVRNGVCGGPPSGATVDGYEKVLFTREYDDKSEIWFTSVEPTQKIPRQNPRAKEPPAPSKHDTHRGRVSKADKSCSSPRFAGDGLSAVWTCDGEKSVVYDAAAEWDQTFEAALAAVDSKPSPACRGWELDLEKCFPKLEKRYASYPAQAISKASDGLANPALSTNHIVALANGEAGVMWRPRYAEKAWKPLGLASGERAEGSHATWSPRGTHLAYVKDGRILVEPTDFYLQTVVNLHHFPQVHGEGESKRLQDNRFVARPGDEKEFYELHDKLRYAEKPQFISTDVALQAFRDEFLSLLQDAERTAADELRAMSEALWKHYFDAWKTSQTNTHRYYATYFATAWVALEAAESMEKMTWEDHMVAQWGRDSASEKERKRFDRVSKPVSQRMPDNMARVTLGLPSELRSMVATYTEKMARHRGIERVEIPSYKTPLSVDFSQFKIRGAYDNELAGYFLAMKWYGFMPLPFDGSLAEFAATLSALRYKNAPVLEMWRDVDGLVGSFMGKPVDPTVDHLMALRADEPQIFSPFDAAAVKKRLAEMRGTIEIRDASGPRNVHLTFFPRRAGLDVTFFRKLTHQKVKYRGMPTSLDVFATLGHERARKHAIAAEPEDRVEEYRSVLASLIEKTPSPESDRGYWNTDIYHSWLAALVVLARSYEVPDESMIEFARSEAWQDRQLYAALAGYTQLKHASVLYAMQDVSAECDGDSSYYVAIEQPIVDPPEGFVEPNAEFYAALAEVAERVYEKLYDGKGDGPSADHWRREEDPRLNALNLARRLEKISRLHLSGKRLDEDDRRWIEYLGGDLEMLTLGKRPGSSNMTIGGQGRVERGVALVTDIHTNKQRQQALHIGVGRIQDLWVVTPHPPANQLTQGGILSFYEFVRPMSDRMTDARWGEALEKGEIPKSPEWTDTFLEAR